MLRQPVIKGVLLAASLAGLAGCSRTDDGTVVPTYTMAVDRYAGIPILTMRRTPLEAPDAAPAAPTLFPPPPPAPAASPQPSIAAPAEAARPIRPRPRRAAVRRVVPQAQPAPPVPEKPLVCRNQTSEDRAVSILCE